MSSNDSKQLIEKNIYIYIFQEKLKIFSSMKLQKE